MQQSSSSGTQSVLEGKPTIRGCFSRLSRAGGLGNVPPRLVTESRFGAMRSTSMATSRSRANGIEGLGRQASLGTVRSLFLV